MTAFIKNPSLKAKEAGTTMFEMPQKSIFVLIMLLHSVSWASNSVACDPQGNKMALNACATAEFVKADKELNDAYQALLTERAKDPFVKRKLQSAQRAWIAFRDAELAARFSCAEKDNRQCWGSMYPMSWNIRKTELTKARTRDLRQMRETGLGQ